MSRWWWVDGEVTVSARIAVRADTVEEAIRDARGADAQLHSEAYSLTLYEYEEAAVVEEADGRFRPLTAAPIPDEELEELLGEDDEEEDE